MAESATRFRSSCLDDSWLCGDAQPKNKKGRGALTLNRVPVDCGIPGKVRGGAVVVDRKAPVS